MLCKFVDLSGNFEVIEITGLSAPARIIGAGLATIGLSGAASGAGHVFANYMLSTSRAPALEFILFRYALIGFALTEAVGLLALMMAFLILFTLLLYS
jgi:F-type H+-transporting ATPase subunit c